MFGCSAIYVFVTLTCLPVANNGCRVRHHHDEGEGEASGGCLLLVEPVAVTDIFIH